MEDCVISWVALGVVVYGVAIRWFIKGLIAERKAKCEEYWSRW